MKFLLDMGIPPRVRDWLREQGHDARHIRDINKRAPDAEILFAARETEAIILTTDKDFGQLMAESQLALPSVILFRLTPAPAEAVIERLAPVIDSYQTELQAGCLITIALGKPRLRRLPLRRSACRRLFFRR